MKRFASRPLGAAVFTAALATTVVVRAAAPAGRYAISAGTVFDSKTHLTWQQTLSTSTYAQSDAVTYCLNLNLQGGAWRVPTMKELVSILDFSVAPPGPTIDPTAFPSTPPNVFWSSTPYAGGTGEAWQVNFGDSTAYAGDTSTTNSVRCVR